MAFKLMDREGGDEDIVIPAVILHDVGWIKIPENLQLKAFGPNAKDPKLNRTHEIEGVRLAAEILHEIQALRSPGGSSDTGENSSGKPEY